MTVELKRLGCSGSQARWRGPSLMCRARRQVRKLRKARRLSGAVLASLRRRRRSDSVASGDDHQADSVTPDGAAGAGGNSDAGNDGDAADEELVAEFEQHQCAALTSTAVSSAGSAALTLARRMALEKKHFFAREFR